MLYQTCRLAKTKGMLALEAHVDKPESSPLFEPFPTFKSDHHAVEFLCDYLRLMTLGTDNAMEVETLMDIELDVHHGEGASGIPRGKHNGGSLSRPRHCGCRLGRD